MAGGGGDLRDARGQAVALGQAVADEEHRLRAVIGGRRDGGGRRTSEGEAGPRHEAREVKETGRPAHLGSMSEMAFGLDLLYRPA
jgi:hypothetical protein